MASGAQLMRLAYSNDHPLNLKNKTRDVWESAFRSRRPVEQEMRMVVETCAQSPFRAAPFIVLATSLTTISTWPGADGPVLHALAREALEMLLGLTSANERFPTSCCPEAITALSPCIRAMRPAIRSSDTDSIVAVCFAALRDSESAARRAAALEALTALATCTSMGHYLCLAVVIAERHAKYDCEPVKSAATAFLAAVEAGGVHEGIRDNVDVEASPAESARAEVELEVALPLSCARAEEEEEDAASSAPVEALSPLCSDLPTLDTALEEEMERFLRGSIAPLPRAQALGPAATYANLVREALEGEETSGLDVSGIEAVLRRCLDLHSEHLYDLHTRRAEATLLKRSQEINDGAELERLAEALEADVHRAVAEEHDWFMEHAMPAIADALANPVQRLALVGF